MIAARSFGPVRLVGEAVRPGGSQHGSPAAASLPDHLGVTCSTRP